MNHTILIGNLVSILSAYFIIKSSISTGKKKIFIYQFLQNLILAISNIILGSFSGATTQILSGVRNLLVAKNLFSKKMCIIILLALTSLGLYTNTRGLLGILPVFATIIYTIGNYLFNKDKYIKLNLTLNMILWGIYDFFILNYTSFGIDMVIVFLTLHSAFTPSPCKKKD